MKQKFSKLTMLALAVVFGIICVGCVDNNSISERELLRLHIRADSNDSLAQSIKLKVRDDIVDYLVDSCGDVETFAEAYSAISARIGELTAIADNRLIAEGAPYRASVKLTREYFPTRAYGKTIVESGYYDALIIELGSGKGDNWWCVIYPPLCYLDATDDFVYKSKIKELIDKFF